MKRKSTFKKCPYCRRSLGEDADISLRPFCSERCRLLDLGAWAGERYIISSPLNDLNAEGEEMAELSPPKDKLN